MRIDLCLLPLLVTAAVAQLPTPSPTPMTTPRAHWSRVLSVPANTPSQRADNMGAASHDTMFIFGGAAGNNTATVLNDLWAFDGTTMTQLLPTGTLPPARARAAIAWNFNTNKLCMFGGNDKGTTNTMLGDTWEYDPVANTWANVTPVGASPSPRQYAAMCWDPASGGMLLFGGQTVTTPVTVSNETWLFQGGVWTQLNPATVPPARTLGKLVSRPGDFDDCVLCGGTDDSHATTPDNLRMLDVWTYAGGDWTKISDFDFQTMTGTFPHSVASCSAVYDQQRKRIVMVGGDGTTNGTTANTTYVYGTLYGGSPSGWLSEFDCYTNTWKLYGAAAFGTNDPTIGRVSRYWGAYLPSTGKVYKVCGQNAAGSGSNPTYVFEYQATPVASATNLGTGCTGSAGQMGLTNLSMPWTGRTFSVQGWGFAPGAIGAVLIGLGTQNTPLSSLHPAGGLGCDVLVTIDTSDLLLPAAGLANYSIAIPSGNGLAGLPLNVQMLSLEFDLSFNLTGLFTTNGCSAVVSAL